jgi:hypothetical protein
MSRSAAVFAERASRGYERATCGHCGLPVRRVLGAMVLTLVKADPNNRALELRTDVCEECGHSQTYSVDGGGQ